MRSNFFSEQFIKLTCDLQQTSQMRCKAWVLATPQHKNNGPDNHKRAVKALGYPFVQLNLDASPC